MKIDGMRHRRSRDLLIDELERELGYHLPIARHDQDLYDVWQLVDVCLGHPGAMHALVEVVSAFHGGSLQVTEVRHLVEDLLPDPLLGARERRELYEIVRLMENEGSRAADLAVVRALYRSAVGPLGPSLDGDVRGIESVVSKLEETATRMDGIPPLLLFIRDLADRAGGPMATALRDWLHRFSELQGLDGTELRQLPALEKPGVEDRAYLAVEIRPDLPGGDKYLVTAWLQFGQEPATTLCCTDDPLSWSDLPRLLEELLVEDHRVVNRHTPELIIEFVVPRGLLNAPLDQFKITIGGFECRLGIVYPVVVRSLDRMRNRAYHHRWQRKWRWLQQNPGSAEFCLIQRPRRIQHERLFTMLSDSSPACLALAFPPWGRGSAPVDEHWVGVVAGVPVLAWSREAREPGRFAAEFRELVRAGVISLPQKVLALRKQAVLVEETDPDHLGLHLTLIFDDADRVPEPYVRLGAPA